MPRGDRTGPYGEGPATGRGLGFCTGHQTPGYTKPRPRLGLQRGFRGGRGRRASRRTPIRRATPLTTRRDVYTQPEQDEKEILKEEKQIIQEEIEELERELEAINEEISEIE